MDKGYLHYVWNRRIKPIRPSYLILVCALFAIVCALSLRENNLGMIQLRNAVYEADEQNGDVEKALYELRSYVYSHMNTNLAGGENPVYPPIQLKYTYQRLVEAEQKRLSDAGSKIYSEAQAECERRFPDSFSGGPRIPCIQEYVTQHGVKPQQIPDGMYKFNFASPTWSPDTAGWTMLLAGLFGILAALRIAAGILARRFLQ